MEYSFISFEKKDSSLSSSLAGVSNSATLPDHTKKKQKKSFAFSSLINNLDNRIIHLSLTWYLPSLRTKTRSLSMTVWIL